MAIKEEVPCLFILFFVKYLTNRRFLINRYLYKQNEECIFKHTLLEFTDKFESP